MEGKYWNTVCSKCDQKIRLTVEPKNHGRRVSVTCPTCGFKTETVIGAPQTEETKWMPEDILEKVKEMAEKIQNIPEMSEMLEFIRNKGFNVGIILGVTKTDTPDTNTVRATIKENVQRMVNEDGSLKEGAFSKEDEEAFAKTFKIKL